ncbi:MAG: glycosyltransferase, partial [Planctomycetota bacterium]
AQQVPDVEFVICGTGADAESLQSQASGITNIYWLTPQPSERFNDLLNCADMHLLPQRAGAADLVMPSKLTGMMASGRPVVACANAGTQIADVVQGRGKVVDAGDAQAFAKAITWLVDHPEDRKDLGRAARTYAVTHLSREAILHQFECDLREVSGRVASTELPPESNRLSEVEAVG